MGAGMGCREIQRGPTRPHYFPFEVRKKITDATRPYYLVHIHLCSRGVRYVSTDFAKCYPRCIRVSAQYPTRSAMYAPYDYLANLRLVRLRRNRYGEKFAPRREVRDCAARELIFRHKLHVERRLLV